MTRLERLRPIIFLVFFMLSVLGNYIFCEESRRDQFLKKYAVPKDAVKLKFLHSFPDDEKDHVYLKSARKINIIGEKIVISDSHRNSIFFFDLKGNFIKSIGRTGKGPGEFLNVLCVDLDNQNRLVVQDDANRRIQYLSMDGYYLDSFKTFKTSESMVTDNRGSIYLSPFQIYSNKDTLVEVFNDSGKLLRGFGKNHIDKNKSYTFLSIDKTRDEIAVAWKYFPKIKVFSTRGTLIADIDINHKLMNENAQKNHKARFKNGRVDLFNVIDSFSYFGGDLFVFKNFPRMEIQRINLEGEIERVYWFEPQDGNVGVKIAIQENKEEYIFYILEIIPENKVLVYSAKK